MSKSLLGLVAYGDSDSDSSDNEDAVMIPSKSPSTQITTPAPSTSQSGKHQVKDSSHESGNIGVDHLTKNGQGTLLKHTLEAEHIKEHQRSYSTESSTTQLNNTFSPSSINLEHGKSQEQGHSTSFARSQSGTPLPADHSAAADVFNTPTTGMSPAPSQLSRIQGEDTMRTGKTAIGDRESLMKALLRPRPIPGVENFGIPPSPEGEVNPDVQAKMEQFQHIKITRGIHFNQSLMKNKNFRNPHIYSSLVELVALNEIGTNFEKKEFFDFESYGPESYAT
ncbi:hypothetical protein BGZ94_001392, partial [Podila epigama]